MKKFINRKICGYKRIVLVFAALCFFPLSTIHAIQIAVDSPINGIKWNLETTVGYQNVSSSLSEKNNNSNTIFFCSGMLFTAEVEHLLLLKSQLTLGFKKNPHFVWTEAPILIREDSVNELLRFVEYDLQIQLPFTFFYSFKLSPFVGYSFFDYSYGQSTTSVSSDATVYIPYQMFVTGVFYHHQFSKLFSDELFFSFSPITRTTDPDHPFQYISYGGNIQFNTHPIAFFLFMSLRRAVFFTENESKNYMTFYKQMTSTEVGFSFHININ